MKRKWKIAIFVLLVVLIAGGVFASIRMNQGATVTVQTGKVARQDLTSLVTASGEIKPKNYINLGANAMGILTRIYVKEGDRVRRSQVVASIESVQAQADVSSQKAAVNSALADSAASEAGTKSMEEAVVTAQATLDRSQADLEKAKLDLDRSKDLFASKLIAKQDFEAKQAAYNSAQATVRESKARLDQAAAQVAQAQAQVSGSQRRVVQAQAVLSRFDDLLAKHNSVAPLDGVVTNLPVRVGETVVMGIQNAQGSTIMTIADMSQITAEVKVDETDIVNVKLGQPATITVDAIPNKTFQGHVSEIGNTAILRSTGLAASQSAVSSQEAKDFKVVVAIDNPSDDLRPGLSCTSKVTTATRKNVLTIPIQALTIRQRGDLDAPKKGNVPVPAKDDAASQKAKKEELQGVFVVKGEKVEFKKVETGITGATDIEVVTGLGQNDEIVTGSYKIIRTIRNEAKVKVDNKAPVVVEKT